MTETDSISPQEIVEKYRALYKKFFMNQAMLQTVPGAEGKYLVYDAGTGNGDELGFKDAYILLKFCDPEYPSEKVLATNEVQINENGEHVAVIVASPTLLHKDTPKSLLKYYLAHEWVEALKGMHDGKRPDKSLNGKNRVAMEVMFDSMRYRTLWADTAEFERDLFLALKHLLMSKESLTKQLKTRYNLTFKQLAEMVEHNADEVQRIFKEITDLFSSKNYVLASAVAVRLQEILSENL